MTRSEPAPRNRKLKQEILKNAAGRKLQCSDALALADRLGASCHEVGQLADELGIKIIGCRLGCF